MAVPELSPSGVFAEDSQLVWPAGARAGGASATQSDDAVDFSNVSCTHTFAWVASTTSANVCTLTKEYVDGSGNHQKLTSIQKAVGALARQHARSPNLANGL